VGEKITRHEFMKTFSSSSSPFFNISFFSKIKNILQKIQGNQLLKYTSLHLKRKIRIRISPKIVLTVQKIIFYARKKNAIFQNLLFAFILSPN